MGYTQSKGRGVSRTRAVRRVLWWVLALNVAVAVAKLFYGVLIDSVSITADGFHSLFDGTSNVIGLIGLSVAARPADRPCSIETGCDLTHEHRPFRPV